jgi:hypothetical protein
LYVGEVTTVSPDEQVQPEVFPVAKLPLVSRLVWAEAAGAAAAPIAIRRQEKMSRGSHRARRKRNGDIDLGMTTSAGTRRRRN